MQLILLKKPKAGKCLFFKFSHFILDENQQTGFQFLF